MRIVKQFEGRVALVTGGGTGIGRAIAERLADAGCKVVIAGRREARLVEVARERPDSISHVVMDLGNWNDHDKALTTVVERHGRLDILVNNAAISSVKPFIDLSREEIASNIHINLTSTALLMHSALPYLIKTKGNIVNVSSANGRYCGMPYTQTSAYSAAKAGINHLTRILATEVGQHGVRVNAVAPGLTDTEMAATAFANPDFMKALVAVTPLGRAGMPDDVAKVVCFMASDEAAWVTGQLVDASGGFAMAA
jgi:NAD(P)-dependent dehydrogenase (short-subunit alcohol dehydrogenase family)